MFCLFRVQWNLFTWLTKFNWYYLKMESHQETAAAIVTLLLVKKEEKDRPGESLDGDDN